MPSTPGRSRDFREPGSSPRWRIGVGAAVVAAVVLLGVLVLVSALTRSTGAVSDLDELTGGATTGAVAGGPGADGSGAGADSPSSVASGGPSIYVHILGRVIAPGLYELPSGSRAVDAVSAAGGFLADADRGAVNLARTVVDGEQIVVPRPGEPMPSAPAVSGSSGSVAQPGAPGVPVDLNTADAATLETLSGVGPATAAAILAWRDEHGRFQSVEDLLDVPGIGEKKLDAIRDQVAAR